jgi:dihydroorotate dehydrogenase
MSLYTQCIRPVLFRQDAERVHDAVIRLSEIAGSLSFVRKMARGFFGFSDARLATEVAGLRFANPVGLAAGYDKSGRAIGMMAALGFGFIEIGSVSADPSAGNPKPRLWRLPQDRAICVHYGLPNDGAEMVGRRLTGRRWAVPLGINVVKTNRGIDAPPDSDAAILDDYVRSVSRLKGLADYVCLNLSCPNTEMGRDFFADPARLAELFAALRELDLRCPLFLKLSPRGGIAAIEQMLETVEPFRFVSGFIFNLPPDKPATLRTPRSVWESLPGAVAGEPARETINTCVRELYRRMDRRRYRIMAAGGVFSSVDAYEKIRLGASLVQLMTALIYDGPGVVKRINQGLCRLLERDGLANIGQAIGTAQSL